MWQIVRPILCELGRFGSSSVVVAGGYGLLRKQMWLAESTDARIVVPLNLWKQPVPRATKDLDLVLRLDLLANEEAHGQITGLLSSHSFLVVEGNERWQFRRQLDDDRSVLIDFHAERPTEEHKNLTTDTRIRVKYKPSLGDGGIHARQNPEAMGSDMNPYSFLHDGVTLFVPNPITWSIMKLVAMKDRRRMSEEAKDEKTRRFHREQAEKHATDTTKIVAMTLLEENDRADDVITKIQGSEGYSNARSAFVDSFGDDAWVAPLASQMWSQADFDSIRSLLSRWLH